jgi:NhaA family Na+:H+ antiporter
MTDAAPLPTFSASDRRLARAIRPVQRFLEVEAAGGIVLLAAAVTGLVWANSPWSESYRDLWETEVELQIGELLTLSDSLGHWVTDGLMTIFFFVVGLEIKRELVTGELRDRRAALLPALAALGGMVVPALIYTSLNGGGDGADGWGIPMATDIAFAVGVLALLGSRVSSPLKVFLLTLAIVDDIGAIAVIALFYSNDLSAAWLAVAVALVGVMYALRQLQVWYLPVYCVVGAFVWLAVYESGVHATIAGVMLGLLAPAEPLKPTVTAQEIDDILADPSIRPADRAELASRIARESVSVADRLERALHPWSTFVVVPVFALANAGVELSAELLDDALTSPITIGVFLGLVAGKVVGVAGSTLLASRAGIAPLPGDATRRQVVGLGGVAGIGFTVALFITALAFDDPRLADEARIGVLAASVVAALLGAAVLVRGPAPRGGATARARR